MRAIILPVLIGVIVLGVIGLSEDAFAESILYGTAHERTFQGNSPSTLYIIDKTDGSTVEVGPIGFNNCSGMDFLLGTMYATCYRSNELVHVLITVNLETGAGTEIGPTNLDTNLFEESTNPDISFRNSDNTLFAFFFDADTDWTPVLATIDISTGGATLIGNTGSTRGGNGIAFSSADTLYHASSRQSFDPINIIDQTTGFSTFLFEVALPDPALTPEGNARPNAADFDPDTGTMYLSIGSGQQAKNLIITLDIASETITNLGDTQVGLDAIAFLPDPDADGDGVSDADDQCSETAAGASVNASGCSLAQLDTDNDGVNDADDVCPATDAEVPVDATGCALSPQDELDVIRGEVSTLITTIDDPKITKKLDKVVDKLDKAVDKLEDLSDTKQVKKGFGDASKAIKEMTKILKKNPELPLDEIIDEIIQVFEGITNDAIAEAESFLPNDKVQKKLDKVNKDLEKFQKELDKGKPDKALDRLKKAYDHAQKAIKHAT